MRASWWRRICQITAATTGSPITNNNPTITCNSEVTTTHFIGSQWKKPRCLLNTGLLSKFGVADGAPPQLCPKPFETGNGTHSRFFRQVKNVVEVDDIRAQWIAPLVPTGEPSVKGPPYPGTGLCPHLKQIVPHGSRVGRLQVWPTFGHPDIKRQAVNPLIATPTGAAAITSAASTG